MAPPPKIRFSFRRPCLENRNELHCCGGRRFPRRSLAFLCSGWPSHDDRAQTRPGCWMRSVHPPKHDHTPPRSSRPPSPPVGIARDYMGGTTKTAGPCYVSNISRLPSTFEPLVSTERPRRSTRTERVISAESQFLRLVSDHRDVTPLVPPNAQDSTIKHPNRRK